jgi:protein disulfide-isomerase
MNDANHKSSTSLFTIIGLSLVLLGGGAWMWVSGKEQPLDHAVDHGQPIPALLASVNGQGVVHLTNWSYDVKAAFAQSKTTGKPVLLMLTADWCGPCQVLKKSVLALPDVDKLVHEKYTPVVWDLTEPTDADIELANKWEAGQAIPELLIFDAQGKTPMRRIVGVVSQEEFEKWLGA